MTIKIKSITFLLMLLTVSFLFITPMKANAQVKVPGTECQPANLSQALGLGLGWSQFGVTNNAPIGNSGFFVACPVNVDDVALGYSEVVINAVFLDPAAQSINCTLFVVFSNSSVFSSENFPTIANPGFTPSNDFTGVFLPFGYEPFGDALNVICALPPQTRIADIVIF